LLARASPYGRIDLNHGALLAESVNRLYPLKKKHDGRAIICARRGINDCGDLKIVHNSE